jgi:Mrp family chromosome partitioning ATPase
MIVAKAVNMAEKMNIPVLGIVENMSYVECPDCGKSINVLAKAGLKRQQKNTDWKCLARCR